MLESLRFGGLGVVVTGAAAGIGAATAAAVGELGARVLAIDLDPAGLEALRERLAKDEVACSTFVADLQIHDDVDRVRREIGETGVVVTSLVNNVGANDRRSIRDQDLPGLTDSLTLNVGSAFLMTQALLEPLLASPRGGSIVNVSSAHGLWGSPAALGYATSKAGLLGLTRQLAAEFGPRGLRVNAVCPGLTMTDRILARDTDASLDHLRDRVLERRFARPDEVAHAIAFLASAASSYISGVTLPVDGGFTVR